MDKEQKNIKIETTNYQRRFCVSCNKITDFRYNKAIGHNACQDCGSRYGKYVEIRKEFLTKEKWKKLYNQMTNTIHKLKEKNKEINIENTKLRDLLKEIKEN